MDFDSMLLCAEKIVLGADRRKDATGRQWRGIRIPIASSIRHRGR